jgi:hypothetical protein
MGLVWEIDKPWLRQGTWRKPSLGNLCSPRPKQPSLCNLFDGDVQQMEANEEILSSTVQGPGQLVSKSPRVAL